MAEIILTTEGVQRFERELEQLKTARRRDVAELLKEAFASGTEVAENGEYFAALEEQERLEQRIAELESRLRQAQVAEAADVPADTTAIGRKVRLKDLETQEVVEVEIVGSGEGNPLEGKISNESPVGSAILGRRKGEIVDVEVPAGLRRMKILRVSPEVERPRPTRKRGPSSRSGGRATGRRS